MSRAQLNQLLRPTMLKRHLKSNVWISAIQHMRRNNRNKEIAQIKYYWANESTFDDKLDSIFIACILPQNDSHIEVMATIRNPDPIVLDEHYENLDNWLLSHVESNPGLWDDAQPIRNIPYELPTTFATVAYRLPTNEEYFDHDPLTAPTELA